MALRARSRKITALAATVFFGASLVGTGTSFAISDGHYRFWRNGCTGSTLNTNRPKNAPHKCKSLILSISDYNGHEYFGAGFPVTANNTPAGKEIDFWADPGLGQDISWSVKGGVVSGVRIVKSTQPAAKPASGMRLYFGANDNLDVGEHDSSGYTNNGPSDGGAIEVNINPRTASYWLAMLQAANLPKLLTQPVPLANGGFGACADGFCMSMATKRKVAYRGWNPAIHRDAADYIWSNGKPQVWKPYVCSGPYDGSNGSKVCDMPSEHKFLGPHNKCYNSNGYMTIACWNKIDGTVYTEPGFQIYEDPDPQGSPGVINLVVPSQILTQRDPVPWPGLYVGSCGVVIGGGPKSLPTHLNLPGTNAAGQYVYKTGCP
jgi:hypothetical protein